MTFNGSLVLQRPEPTWAQGGGIPVTKTELVEGRIVHTLEDGTKVMTEIVDIWRP